MQAELLDYEAWRGSDQGEGEARGNRPRGKSGARPQEMTKEEGHIKHRRNGRCSSARALGKDEPVTERSRGSQDDDDDRHSTRNGTSGKRPVTL